MRVFTGGETWTGGFYELALEYERDSGGVVDGLNALWKLEDIEGCYRSFPEPPSRWALLVSKPPATFMRRIWLPPGSLPRDITDCSYPLPAGSSGTRVPKSSDRDRAIGAGQRCLEDAKPWPETCQISCNS